MKNYDHPHRKSQENSHQSHPRQDDQAPYDQKKGLQSPEKLQPKSYT